MTKTLALSLAAAALLAGCYVLALSWRLVDRLC